MLAIRFNRTGKRNHASFRVVLQEHTKAPGKRHVEILGSYDPHKKTTILKKDRILYWIGQGAQASPVVTNLLVREGVIEGKKIAKKMPRPVVKEPAVAEVIADKGLKTEGAAAPVATDIEAKAPAVADALAGEGVKTEEISVPVAVPEGKAEETVPVAETVVENIPAPVAAEEVPAPKA